MEGGAMILTRVGQDRRLPPMHPALVKFHRYLFLLSHPRSYSTLLCHILGSHPHISGYIESLISYVTAVDLIHLNRIALWAENYRGDCEYVIDKLLYDQLIVSDVVLRNPRVTLLFVVREAEPSIASLVRMKVREHQLGLQDWSDPAESLAWNAHAAAELYIARLQTLQALCARLEALGRRGIFLTAESLLAETPATFRLLERELGLSEPLREEYHLFPGTGVAGKGDTSPAIRSGRIVRDRDRQDELPIPIPPDQLDRARQSYAECLAAFRASPAMARIGE
jgi:hypothetical protein